MDEKDWWEKKKRLDAGELVYRKDTSDSVYGTLRRLQEDLTPDFTLNFQFNSNPKLISVSSVVNAGYWTGIGAVVGQESFLGAVVGADVGLAGFLALLLYRQTQFWDPDYPYWDDPLFVMARDNVISHDPDKSRLSWKDLVQTPDFQYARWKVEGYPFLHVFNRQTGLPASPDDPPIDWTPINPINGGKARMNEAFKAVVYRLKLEYPAYHDWSDRKVFAAVHSSGAGSSLWNRTNEITKEIVDHVNEPNKRDYPAGIDANARDIYRRAYGIEFETAWEFFRTMFPLAKKTDFAQWSESVYGSHGINKLPYDDAPTKPYDSSTEDWFQKTYAITLEAALKAYRKAYPLPKEYMHGGFFGWANVTYKHV